jgi:hypothetical protein
MTRAVLSASLQAAGGSTLVLVASSHRQARADPRRGWTHSEAHPKSGREICTGVKKDPQSQDGTRPNGTPGARSWVGGKTRADRKHRTGGWGRHVLSTDEPGRNYQNRLHDGFLFRVLEPFEGGGQLEAV